MTKMLRVLLVVCLGAAVVVSIGDTSITPAAATSAVDDCAGQERVVFTGSRFQGLTELFAMNPDGSVLTSIAAADPLAIDDVIASAGVSPDGMSVLWRRGSRLEIGPITGADNRVLVDEGDSIGRTVWTTDSRSIVWEHGAPPNRTIETIDVDGTNRGSPIPTTPSDYLSHSFPTTGPDGVIMWVARFFGTGNEFATGEIGTVGFTTEDIRGFYPVLSPDGSAVATYVADSIYVNRFDGDGFVEIIEVPGTSEFTGVNALQWSPDGTRLVFTTAFDQLDAYGGFVWEVAVVDADGDNFRRLTAGDAHEYSGAAWAPDGVRLLVRRSDTSIANDPMRLAVLDADTTVVTDLDTGDIASPRGAQWACGDVQCPDVDTPFTDVPATSFAVDDVACIFGLEVTNGTSGTTYSPADRVTREQMAAFLARLWRGMKGDCTQAVPTAFVDLAGSFAAADVSCIFGLGVTNGTSATTYSPADFVTREQMAAFLARLWRAAGGPCRSEATPIADTSGSFAENDVTCIYHLGITTGTSDTTYSPANFVTREQMAAFLARFWRLAVAHGLKTTP